MNFLSSELGNTELKPVYFNFYPELLTSVFRLTAQSHFLKSNTSCCKFLFTEML